MVLADKSFNAKPLPFQRPFYRLAVRNYAAELNFAPPTRGTLTVECQKNLSFN
jgi:hypothetical protein